MKLKHPTVWLEERPALAWTLAAAYMVLIFVLSSFPYSPPQPSMIREFSATFKHFLEYSVFGFLLLACFRSSNKTQKFAFLAAIITATLYGLTDEFHQIFVPYRTASLIDVLADSTGSIVGAFFANPNILTRKFKL